jgi:Gram-negative bacterial TonB protein C-terminal
MIRLQLIDRGVGAAPRTKPMVFPYSGPILDRHYMPGRGLLYSFLVHEVILFGFLFLFGPGLVKARPTERVAWIDLKKPLVLYLPNLGGGDAGDTPEEKKAEAPRKAVAAKPTGKGLIYPGPQPIRSDFPNPTNSIQTLLRPTLKNLPILPPPLKLPNIVQMASVTLPAPPPPPPPPPPKLQPQIKPIEARVDLVTSVPANPPKTVPRLIVPAGPEPVLPKPVEAPKLVEVPKPVEAPKLVELSRPVNPFRPVEPSSPVELPKAPEPPPKLVDVPKPVEAPKLVELSRPAGPARPVEPSKPVELPKAPEPVEPLLALSPTPAPPDEAVKIPAGEARGRFAIGPDSNLAGLDAAAGSKDATSPPTAGIANPRAAATGTASPGNASASSDSGGKPGADNTKDKDGNGGVGSVNPKSNSAGGGTGAAAGDGSAPGRGVGTGRNAFPGVTIVGGNNDGSTGRGSAPGNSPSGNPGPPRTPYGVSIVTSGSTGGGLPSLGVFTNEQIYTAYLDMKWPNGAAAPSWTFEYAVIQKPAAAPAAPKAPPRNNEVRLPTRSQQGLVLPFPMTKEQPVLPAEIVRKYLRRLVIVYAVLTADGKMEQIVVKESPDALLNEPVLNALSKWSFRPAQVNGEPVSVKVLLGFPLALSE